MRVASFYRFLDLADASGFRDELFETCKANDAVGTILVATEGFNGTLAGGEESIRSVLGWIEKQLSLHAPVDARWTDAAQAPFRRLRVKLKKEIVTLGRPDILPQRQVGSYVKPGDWNTLIDDPDVVLIDTRNHYEVEVGTFPGALDPGTDRFRDFARFAEELAGKAKDKTLAMFCTGGIRCEKATALMLELGFDEVYHLQGGILNYLQQIPETDSRWQGECFVFDTRVAVDRDLSEGGYVQCHSCRRPLSSNDLASTDYREGVSCPGCIGELDEERAGRLEERRRQVALATERGEPHIGAKIPAGSLHNGAEKSKRS